MKRNRWYIFLIAVVISAGSVRGNTTGDIHDNLGAEYNYLKWDCLIKGDKLALTINASLTIYNARGEDYAFVSIAENKYVKLKKAAIRVTGPDGELVFKRSKKDLKRAVGYSAYALYSDNIHYYEELTAPLYPYTIEYEYTKETSSLFFWPAAPFQYDIPVTRAEYRLTADPEFEFQYRWIGTNLEPTVETIGDKLVYTWADDSIPALEEIDYLPPDSSPLRELQFCADTMRIEKYSIAGLSWTNTVSYTHLRAHET